MSTAREILDAELKPEEIRKLFQPTLTEIEEKLLQELVQHIVNREHDQLEKKLQSLFLSDPKSLKELFKGRTWVPNSEFRHDMYPDLPHTLLTFSKKSRDSKLAKITKTYFEKVFGAEAEGELMRQAVIFFNRLKLRKQEEIEKQREERRREARLTDLFASISRFARTLEESKGQTESELMSDPMIQAALVEFRKKLSESEKGDSKKEPSRP